MRAITFGDVVTVGLGPNVGQNQSYETCVECGAAASWAFEAGGYVISGWTNVDWCRAHVPTCVPGPNGELVYRRFSGDDVVVVVGDGRVVRLQDGRLSGWDPNYGECFAQPWREPSQETAAALRQYLTFLLSVTEKENK